MKNIPAARRREVLTRTKGKQLRMKSWKRLLNGLLGKDTKAIEDLCVLSLDYNECKLQLLKMKLDSCFFLIILKQVKDHAKINNRLLLGR
jgi:hypothetical protein